MFLNMIASEYNLKHCGYFCPSCHGKTGFFEIEGRMISFPW